MDLIVHPFSWYPDILLCPRPTQTHDLSLSRQYDRRGKEVLEQLLDQLEWDPMLLPVDFECS